MAEITLGGAGLGVLVAALVFVVRKLGVSSRFLPLVSLVIGVLLGLTANLVGQLPLVESVVSGGLIGLATSGGYDVVRKTVLGK